MITVTNPWTNESYDIDPEEISENSYNFIVNSMNDDIREQLHNELAPCSSEEFLTRYAELDPEGFSAIYHS